MLNLHSNRYTADVFLFTVLTGFRPSIRVLIHRRGIRYSKNKPVAEKWCISKDFEMTLSRFLRHSQTISNGKFHRFGDSIYKLTQSDVITAFSSFLCKLMIENMLTIPFKDFCFSFFPFHLPPVRSISPQIRPCFSRTPSCPASHLPSSRSTWTTACFLNNIQTVSASQPSPTASIRSVRYFSICFHSLDPEPLVPSPTSAASSSAGYVAPVSVLCSASFFPLSSGTISVGSTCPIMLQHPHIPLHSYSNRIDSSSVSCKARGDLWIANIAPPPTCLHHSIRRSSHDESSKFLLLLLHLIPADEQRMQFFNVNQDQWKCKIFQHVQHSIDPHTLSVSGMAYSWRPSTKVNFPYENSSACWDKPSTQFMSP